jgi:VanZ family protein
MTKRTRDLLLYWLPPAGWAGGIFLLSCISFGPSTPSYPFEDKVVHLLLFGTLSLLVLRALRQLHGIDVRRASLLAFCATVVYGGLDELHQLLTPLRTASAWDWLADAAGAAAAFLPRRGGRGSDAGPK